MWVLDNQIFQFYRDRSVDMCSKISVQVATHPDSPQSESVSWFSEDATKDLQWFVWAHRLHPAQKLSIKEIFSSTSQSRCQPIGPTFDQPACPPRLIASAVGVGTSPECVNLSPKMRLRERPSSGPARAFLGFRLTITRWVNKVYTNDVFDIAWWVSAFDSIRRLIKMLGQADSSLK